MNTVKKKVKQALNYLTTAYQNGLIGYPRVDNDFVVESGRLAIFPHPAFPPMSNALRPFKNKDKIKVDKQEVILFLSSVGIISPSQIEGVFDYLDYLLDESFDFRSKKLEEDANLIIKLLAEYLEEIGMKDNEVLSLRKEFYDSLYESGGGLRIYFDDKIKIMPEGAASRTNNIAKCGYLIREANKKNPLAKFGGVEPISDLRSALEEFGEEHHGQKNALGNPGLK